MKTVKIDVTKLDKSAFFKGAKGTYADIVLWDKPDDYGNDGYVTQDLGKERRLAGEKSAFIGSWKEMGPRADSPAPKPAPLQVMDDGDGDDIPF